MPIDVSKIDGDMWPSYERCENLSCHAAELRTVPLIFSSNAVPRVSARDFFAIISGKKLEFFRHLFAIKFLHGRVL